MVAVCGLLFNRACSNSVTTFPLFLFHFPLTGVAVLTAHNDELLCNNVEEEEGEEEGGEGGEEVDWQHSEKHSSVSFFKSFNSHFEQIFSGLSRPKLVRCYDSNGKEHKQVVKSGDDLRQDAVMQQFFRVVNALLRKDINVNKRSLQIRTYRVVPLTKTGVCLFLLFLLFFVLPVLPVLPVPPVPPVPSGIACWGCFFCTATDTPTTTATTLLFFHQSV